MIPQHENALQADELSKASSAVDVLVKTVRVIANLSIKQSVGEDIATCDDVVVLLLQVLGSHQIFNLRNSLTCLHGHVFVFGLVENAHLSTKEELVLNTLSTLNNLSYYCVSGNAVTKQQMRVAEGAFCGFTA